MRSLLNIVVAVLLATTPAARAQEERALVLDDLVALVRGPVAEKIGLPDETRQKAEGLVRDHYRGFANLLRSYPRGEQDREGVDIRKKIQGQFADLTAKTKMELVELLDVRQRMALLEMHPSRRAAEPLSGLTVLYSPTPSYLQTLGLFKDQWREQYARRSFKQPAWDASDASPEGRQRFARQVAGHYAEIDAAIHEQLTYEQQVLLVKLLRENEKAKPYLRVLFNDSTETFKLERLTTPELAVELTGCFARLVRKGKPDSDYLVHPADRVLTLHAFSPDGKWLATVGSRLPEIRAFSDHRPLPPLSLLRVWNVETGALVIDDTSQREIHGLAFVDESLLLLGQRWVRPR